MDGPLRAVDLFSGAGGFSVGLRKAGFSISFAVDSWAPAVDTYRLNFDHPVLQEDLARTTADALWAKAGEPPQALDLVVGGPPCQGFSIQRIGPDSDHRNHLVMEFGRLVLDFAPRMFIMENVPGILGRRGEELVAEFHAQMLAGGYDLYALKANAAEFGVPQTRKRVFFCGWKRGELEPFPFPVPSHSPEEYVTVWEAIGDLPKPPSDHSPAPDDPLHRRMRLSAKNLERLRHIPPGAGFESLPERLRVDCHKAGAERIGHRNVYGRLHPDEPAGTITARFDSFTRGKFAHPHEDRNISLREGARLQTFDDDFTFAGTQEEIAALIGNAVPPRFAQVLAEAAAAHLTGKNVQGQIPASSPATGIQLSLFAAAREA